MSGNAESHRPMRSRREVRKNYWNLLVKKNRFAFAAVNELRESLKDTRHRCASARIRRPRGQFASGRQGIEAHEFQPQHVQGRGREHGFMGPPAIEKEVV